MSSSTILTSSLFLVSIAAQCCENTFVTVTVRNSPPKTARAPPVTGTSLPMELPRERAGAGVYGGPAGGAIGCDAIVSKDRFYLAR